MRNAIARSAVPLLAAAAVAACSQDAEVADPGGMGAGRPDTAGSAEVPAESILPYSTQGALTDTSDLVADPRQGGAGSDTAVRPR